MNSTAEQDAATEGPGREGRAGTAGVNGGRSTVWTKRGRSVDAVDRVDCNYSLSPSTSSTPSTLSREPYFLPAPTIASTTFGSFGRSPAGTSRRVVSRHDGSRA